MNTTSNELFIRRLDAASHKKMYPSNSPKKELSLRRILLVTRLWNDVRRQQVTPGCYDNPTTTSSPAATLTSEDIWMATKEDELTCFDDLSNACFDWSWLDKFGPCEESEPASSSSTTTQVDSPEPVAHDALSLLSHTPSENFKEDELASLMLMINGNEFTESELTHDDTTVSPPQPQQHKRGHDDVEPPETSEPLEDGSDKLFPLRRVKQRNATTDLADEVTPSPTGATSGKPVMLSA